MVVAPPARVDREVGEDPFDPGRGVDDHPLLGPQPQREQAGGELGDPLAGARPGHRLPGLGVVRADLGQRKASAVGVAATRSASIRATEGARWIASVTVDLLVAAVLGYFSGCQIPPGTGGDRPDRYGKAEAARSPRGEAPGRVEEDSGTGE